MVIVEPLWRWVNDWECVLETPMVPGEGFWVDRSHWRVPAIRRLITDSIWPFGLELVRKQDNAVLLGITYGDAI